MRMENIYYGNTNQKRAGKHYLQKQTNIIVNAEILGVFHLRSGNKKRMATIITFTHHHTGGARQYNKGRKRNKRYKNWKGRKITKIHI